jgi:hypothetical protein
MGSIRMTVAAAARCGDRAFGSYPSRADRAYRAASIATTLRSSLNPNLGAAARTASAM